jgi:hypothetical protein
MLLKNEASFYKTTFLIAIAIWAWFFGDYEMLRVEKYYWFSFCIAITFLGYGLLIKQYSITEVKLGQLGSLLPLSVIIIQKPLRFTFKQIFKREPVVERNDTTLWDTLYAIILFFASVFIPLIIGDKWN